MDVAQIQVNMKIILISQPCLVFVENILNNNFHLLTIEFQAKNYIRILILIIYYE